MGDPFHHEIILSPIYVNYYHHPHNNTNIIGIAVPPVPTMTAAPLGLSGPVRGVGGPAPQSMQPGGRGGNSHSIGFYIIYIYIQFRIL